MALLSNRQATFHAARTLEERSTRTLVGMTNLHPRTLLIACIAGGALLAPAAADAAKLKISGGTRPVDDNGVAAIKLKNPNRSTARGKLTLTSGGQSIGAHSFKIRARRSSTVRVTVTHVDALQILARGDGLRTTALAKAKGKGTARKSLVLYYPGASSGGGGAQPGGQQQPPPQQPASQSIDGRWQGTYETSNADLAFNITGNRLYTGPFDAFFLIANCADGNPDSTAIEPVQATINPDGSFAGSGTYRPSPDSAVSWTLTGHISGRTMTGTFSGTYEDGLQGHCSGSMNFTAAWYGDYTL
jgi:hypothetical protein